MRASLAAVYIDYGNVLHPQADYNPSTWMLEVSTDTKSPIDFAEQYSVSELHT